MLSIRTQKIIAISLKKGEISSTVPQPRPKNSEKYPFCDDKFIGSKTTQRKFYCFQR